MPTMKIRENGIVAAFGTPDDGGPFPGVLALGGSDGGTPEYFLNLLVPRASRFSRFSTGARTRRRCR
ncbi:MAG TPA: hypothetical protein VH436_11645 [Vicinamibacterales bacterium]